MILESGLTLIQMGLAILRIISLDDPGIVEISLEYESTQDKTWSPYEDVLIHGETEVIFNDGCLSLHKILNSRLKHDQ